MNRPTTPATLACLLLFTTPGCIFAPEHGEERWQQFLAVGPENLGPLPKLQVEPSSVVPGERFTITASIERESHLYLFLMLPNDDLYMLVPSPQLSNNLSSRLSFPPPDAKFELVAPPGLQGLIRLGVIASEQNLNLLSEGWLPAAANREFPTWPADLDLARALRFIKVSLSEKPWAKAVAELEVKAPSANRLP